MSDLRFVTKFLQVSHLSMSNSCDTDLTAHRQVKNHKIKFIKSVSVSLSAD